MTAKSLKLAEGVGFQPTVRSRVQRFSSLKATVLPRIGPVWLIPSCLGILRRHAGGTPLDQLSAEILGLSKMNWNTFDLYTKLPATLQSSGEIARIGSLLQRFGASSYDYRLFI